MPAADWIATFRDAEWLNENRFEPPQDKMLEFKFRSGVPIYLKGADHSGKLPGGAKPLIPMESASIRSNSILMIETNGRRTWLHLDYLEQIVEWDEHGKG